MIETSGGPPGSRSGAVGGGLGGIDVLGALADGVTVHDPSGRYLFVSPSFETLLGWPADRLVGQSPFTLDLFHPEDLDAVVDVQATALETREPFEVTYRLRRADEAFIWVSSTGRVVSAAEEDRFVVSTRPASHIESLLRGLEHERELKRRLRDVVDQQRQFLTAVSHRARTPLTSVLGIAQLLRGFEDRMDPDQRTLLLNRLVDNAEKLVDLLVEVTEADRLARSAAVLNRRLVDLRELAHEAVADLIASNARIDITIPPDLRVVVDPDKTSRIIETLVGNALTHGGVGVSITVHATADRGAVTLTVEDDGPGVEDEIKNRVFGAFERGSANQADPGAGLGLYLVSELAALHRGRAWVEDRDGGGARFLVVLPRNHQGDAP